MGLENIGDSRVADLVADFGRVRPGSDRNPTLDFPWRTAESSRRSLGGFLVVLVSSPFDPSSPISWRPVSMPTQNRIRCEQRAEFLQSFATEDLTLQREAATLVIVEQDSFLSKLLLENSIFGSQIFDHFLLLAIDPASENHQVELPGLEDEGHDCEDSEIFKIMGWNGSVN